jgi:hypothetical protein
MTAILLMLASLLGDPSGPASRPTGPRLRVVMGQIYDGTGARAVRNVLVELTSPSAPRWRKVDLSGPEGGFTFAGRLPDDLVLTARKRNWRPSRMVVEGPRWPVTVTFLVLEADESFVHYEANRSCVKPPDLVPVVEMGKVWAADEREDAALEAARRKPR